jgi:hypothetical protein
VATTIKLKNSVVKDKVPLPSGLEIGELAVGAHSESPALFFKDNADNIIKLEPGGSGVEPSPTPPVGPDEGDLWYDTGKNTLNYWDGASWVELGQAGDSPVTSVNGEVGVVVLEAADVGALAPGDLISELENDLGFLEPGDNVSELSNDAGYLTGTDGDGFVDVDGDNMTGDLTLGTDKIVLDATNGSITAAGNVTTSSSIFATGGVQSGAVSTGSAGQAGVKLVNDGSIVTQRSASGTCFEVYNSTSKTINLDSSGSASFVGKVTANSFDIEALPALPA